MPEQTRADALRSREALLDAFAELVAEVGERVPMYEVARRAGVGQGTLYRHFPTRSDLAAALFERINDDLEAMASEYAADDDLLERLVAAVASHQGRMHALSVALWTSEASRADVDHLMARTTRLFEHPLARAKAAGRVRADLTVQDLLSVTAMVEGVLMGVSDSAARDAAVGRSLDLIWSGLRIEADLPPGR